MGLRNSAVAKLLGTGDEKTQIERIRCLMQPVATITIQFDPRNGRLQLNTVGEGLTYPGLRSILAAATEQLIAKEQQAAAQRATPPTTAAPTAGTSTTAAAPADSAACNTHA
jgi:hypothetical protein